MYLPQLESSVVGRGLLWALGAYSTKQQLRNGASVMYQGITEAAENTELQQGEQRRGWNVLRGRQLLHGPRVGQHGPAAAVP